MKKESQKLCPRCEASQPESQFHWKRKAENQRHSHCKSCVSHKQIGRDRSTYNYERFLRGREFLNTKKDVPCMDCHQRFPPYVMDFDHRDPSNKVFSIAQGCHRSIENLELEIAKCDIVCANCHRIRTYEGRNNAVQRSPA